MSGLEILGIAASILQIADLGATVSVKLCTLYRQLKAADQAAQSLSSEVALTCSILRQLGENLKQDEQTRLYSAQAFETAQEVLRECEKVFRRISAAVDESRGDATKNAIQRAARRLGFVLMERELDVLRGNLERLKSTMLLLLNVIMYAGQVRSRAESSVLQEQRDLIRVLVEEKKASERRLDQLRRSDELVTALDSLGVDANHSEGSAVQDTLPPYEFLAQEDALRELRTYHQLVKRLLQEVDACKSGIERSRYSRIRNGVVRVHAAEVEQFQQAHGPTVTRLFEDPLFSLAPESSRSQHLKENVASRNETSSRGSGGGQEDLKKTNKEPDALPKGILKPPREKFPEDPNPVREGVAPLKDADKKGIPPGARCTEIYRRLVGNERYEERPDYVLDTQNQEDGKTEEGERRQRREDIARRRRAEEVDARRHRNFPAEPYGRDDLPLQQSGCIDADDFPIDSPTERFRVSDRMSYYLPRSRAAFDYAPPHPRSANRSRRRRQDDTAMFDIEWEDETILQRRRRRRAGTSVSREDSPRPQHEYDLLDEQRILEKNDAREDPELIKQQMEIERLEQELARRRSEHKDNQVQLIKEEEDREDEISEHLRRLERFEKKQRMEEERKEAKFHLKLREFEEAERQATEQELARQSREHVDVIPVSATETEQEVKEAVDAVDDLLLKWTTLGQDDLLA